MYFPSVSIYPLSPNTNDNFLRWGVSGLQRSGGLACQDSGCDGKIFWEDGTPFLHDPDVIPTVRAYRSTGWECFVMSKSTGKVENVSTCGNRFNFLCKIEF